MAHMRGLAQSVAINSSGQSGNPSSLLDVNSSGASFQGVLVPRLNTSQRDSIVNPAQALIIYNTTVKCFEFYENWAWQSINCATPAFAPGASVGGGLAFYTDGTKCYVSAPTDQSTGATWGCNSLVGAGAQGTAIGTGITNTATIVAAGCAISGSAAKLCDDLVLGGYSDWFLPSENELAQMVTQNIYLNLGGGMVRSSSEVSSNLARAYWFVTGQMYSVEKSNTGYSVRCIRSF